MTFSPQAQKKKQKNLYIENPGVMKTICHKMHNITSETSVLCANIYAFSEGQCSAGIFQKSLCLPVNRGSQSEKVKQK